MSFPTSFYKEIILSSAKTFRAEKDCEIGSEKWRITVETASLYISSTDKILDIFANDIDKLWDLESIQNKMEESVDEHQVKLIIDVLVEKKFIEKIEKEGQINYRKTKTHITDSMSCQAKITGYLLVLVGSILMHKLTMKESEFEKLMKDLKMFACFPLLAAGYGLEFVGRSIQNRFLPIFHEYIRFQIQRPLPDPTL